MRNIKILHTADIHFDTPFSGMAPNKAVKSREELKQVFENIVSISLSEKIDVLLVAGDVFDNLSVNKSTLYFIKSCFEKINNIKVFISPGNHDPLNEKSFYNLVKWPDNVYIFKGKMEKVIVDDLNTVVWGAGFISEHIKKSMLQNVNRIEGYNNIMVIHGELASSINGNEYNPITEEEIGKSNMDYIALGHRHKFSEIKKINNTYYSYSGCPQGRGFDELDDKGVVIIELKNRIIEGKFIRTSLRNYYEMEINIENSFGYNEIKNKIISEISKEDRQRNLYKIILKGEVSDEFTINESMIEELIKSDFYFVKIIDRSEFKLDMEDLIKGHSIKSIFAKKLYDKLLDAKTDEERENVKLALKIGIQSLSGEEIRLNET